MRTIGVIAALGLLGCGHGKSPATDGQGPPPHDADPNQCSALPGTADVLFTNQAASDTFARLDAGALWETGPVNGADVGGAPMIVTLLFTNADPLGPNVAPCCAASDAACCPAEGLTMQTPSLPDGGEVGTHTATFKGFRDQSVMLDGTVTITKFQHPFQQAPGRIAGTVNVTTNTRTVTGSFDNSFCAILLSATI